MTDLSSLMPGDAVVALRTLPRRYSAALGVADEVTEARAHRIGAEGVSAVEVVLTTIATWSVLEGALRQVAHSDDPVLHPAVSDQRLRSIETSTTEPTEVVIAQLGDAATSLCELADSIKGRDWSRTGTAGGETRTALDLLRDAVGVGVDGLGRVERIIASLD